jgi:ribonuclease III
MESEKIPELEKQLGYNFQQKEKLIRALTHPTYSKEKKEKKNGASVYPHQETYATLGDAILKAGFICLLMKNGMDSKGDITTVKADWENNLKLAEVGERLCLLENNLIKHRMGSGDELKRGMETLRANTVEALIGAIFIDSKSLRTTMHSISIIFKPELRELEKKVVI